MGALTEIMGAATVNIVGVMGPMTAGWKSVAERVIARATQGHTKLTELMMEPQERCCLASRWNTDAMCGSVN